jgi:hypothetical protein
MTSTTLAATTTARPGSTATSLPAPLRASVMVPAGLAMLAGLDAALVLLGVPAPVRTDRLADMHGMLMTLGFVGTLVAVERSVALRRRIGLLAPAALGLGSLLLVGPVPLAVGRTVLLAGTVGLLAVYVPLWRRQRDDAVLVQALAVVPAIGAAAMWLGGLDVPRLVPWLVAFLVLTIAGERLELARLAMGPSAGPVLVGLSGAVLAGTTAALLWPRPGTALLGLALLVLAGWLGAHDVARRTIRSGGVTRFMAAAMLAGYGWLLVTAAAWLVGGPAYDGATYDTVVHAAFLGFTLSMVMAHAPVILPAVLRRPLPWHPTLWGPLALLHASLVVRLWLGDAHDVRLAWQVGGVLNVVALLLFVLTAAWSSARGTRGSSEP